MIAAAHSNQEGHVQNANKAQQLVMASQEAQIQDQEMILMIL